MNPSRNFDDEIAGSLRSLIELNPSMESQNESWQELAKKINDQLALVPDIERYRFHYATYFVLEGSTFARDPDYYHQEQNKIREMVASYYG